MLKFLRFLFGVFILTLVPSMLLLTFQIWLMWQIELATYERDKDKSFSEKLDAAMRETNAFYFISDDLKYGIQQ